MSARDTIEQAEAASPVAAGWIAENMAGNIELDDVSMNEVLLSTTLGVMPSTSERA